MQYSVYLIIRLDIVVLGDALIKSVSGYTLFSWAIIREWTRIIDGISFRSRGSDKGVEFKVQAWVL